MTVEQTNDGVVLRSAKGKKTRTFPDLMGFIYKGPPLSVEEMIASAIEALVES